MKRERSPSPPSDNRNQRRGPPQAPPDFNPAEYTSTTIAQQLLLGAPNAIQRAPTFPLQQPPQYTTITIPSTANPLQGAPPHYSTIVTSSSAHFRQGPPPLQPLQQQPQPLLLQPPPQLQPLQQQPPPQLQPPAYHHQLGYLQQRPPLAPARPPQFQDPMYRLRRNPMHPPQPFSLQPIPEESMHGNLLNSVAPEYYQRLGSTLAQPTSPVSFAGDQHHPIPPAPSAAAGPSSSRNRGAAEDEDEEMSDQ